MPFDRIEIFARFSDRFRFNLHKLLSLEYARAQTLTLLLTTMRADGRLAVFLLDMGERYKSHGFSSCEFVLRLTREEIGSYLGLKLETVSRTLSKFAADGLVEVEQRNVRILDPEALRRIVNPPGC